MKFEIEHDRLSTILDSLSSLVDEAVFEFSEGQVVSNAIEPSKVGMVEVEVESDAFDLYEGDDTRRGFNLNRFEDIISMADSDNVSVESAGDGSVEIQHGGLNYKMSQINPDSIREPPKRIRAIDDPGTNLSVPVDEFSNAIDACGMVSNHLRVIIDDGNFMFKAEGDTDEVEYEIGVGEDEDEGVVFEDDEPDDVEAIYSLKHLKDINKSLPNSGTISIEVGTDMPLRLSLDEYDGNVKIWFVVAPRIDDS